MFVKDLIVATKAMRSLLIGAIMLFAQTMAPFAKAEETLGLARLAKQPGAERCLALALYWEARAEGRDGMVAVAWAIVNRVRHHAFPDTICAVVKEGGESPPCQFSWWCDGKSDMPSDARAWRAAEQTARRFLHAAPPDPTGGALFFHHTALLPPWKIKRLRTAIIGRHAYYR